METLGVFGGPELSDVPKARAATATRGSAVYDSKVLGWPAAALVMARGARNHALGARSGHGGNKLASGFGQTSPRKEHPNQTRHRPRWLSRRYAANSPTRRSGPPRSKRIRTASPRSSSICRENLTAWKIRAWGMGHGTRVGRRSAEVVTRKNVIVRLQAPRFFVEKR